MRRIPPSEQIRKQLNELLNNGLEGQNNLVGALVQLGAQLVVQELHTARLVCDPGHYHRCRVFGPNWDPVDTSTPARAHIEDQLAEYTDYYLAQQGAGVGVGVLAGLRVDVGLGVHVGILVRVGVIVAVAVSVGIAVRLGVALGTGEGVDVGSGMGVAAISAICAVRVAQAARSRTVTATDTLRPRIP